MSTADEEVSAALPEVLDPQPCTRVRLFIPKDPDNSMTWVLEAARRLTELQGGSTTFNGIGTYKMQDGSIVTEPVTIVESFGDADHQSIQRLAADIRNALGEESVAVELTDTATAFV